MRSFFLLIVSALLVFSGPTGPAEVLAQTAAFETKAKEIYLVEAATGTVLLAKNENETIQAASLAKLMTAEYVFNELKSGRLSPETEYKVSEYAWRTGGALSRTATMFAALNSNVRVMDLLQGVIVQSANDGCIILAEGLAGSEAEFAGKLTARARELGLEKSNFADSSGRPNPENRVTMRELVTLARHMQRQYPDYYRLYSQADFEWNKIRQRNKNPLLNLDIGVDGMATGYSEESGYGIVASVERGGTRLFLAMSGLKSDKERIEESRRVLEWGLANFSRHTVFKAGEVIAEAAVFGGSASHVPLLSAGSVDIFVANDNPDRIRARITYRWPLKAPVTKDQQIGTLLIFVGDRQVLSVPVHAASDVGIGTLTSKAYDGLKELLFFWL